MNLEVQHSDPVKVKANGIEIVYDTFGERSAPALLLVMGLGAQMVAWDEDFCAQLAGKGYWVIRYDNRDVGFSTRFDDLGVPDITKFIQSAMEQAQWGVMPLAAPYYLWDMADDAVGLLDAIGVERAHVVGVSMGGMIVQEMAIRHAERIRTMTSIMSSTGFPMLPFPQPEAIAVLLKPPAANRADHIADSIAATQVLNGTVYPIDKERVRERAGRAFDRGLSPTGTTRQMAAILASGNRKEALKSVTIPTLVIHGNADPLVPVEGGIDTAEVIPGAQLLIIEGMGHDLPAGVWPRVMQAVVNHAV